MCIHGPIYNTVAIYLLYLEQTQQSAEIQDSIAMQEATASTSEAMNVTQNEQNQVRKRSCGKCEPKRELWRVQTLQVSLSSDVHFYYMGGRTGLAGQSNC